MILQNFLNIIVTCTSIESTHQPEFVVEYNTLMVLLETVMKVTAQAAGLSVANFL